MMDSFRPHEFKATLWKLIQHLGPVMSDITLGGEAFLKGDWYTAGKMLGFIFHIITEVGESSGDLVKSAGTINSLL